jgi:hypothetical protein
LVAQAKPNTCVLVQTVTALSEHGKVFDAIVHDRVDYAAAMADGRTPLEIDANGAAAGEAAAIWRLVCKQLAKRLNLTKKRRTTKRGESMPTEFRERFRCAAFRARLKHVQVLVRAFELWEEQEGEELACKGRRKQTA